jgi:inorganic pyrophosphatase
MTMEPLWLGPLAWAVLYSSDLILTITCARPYQAQHKIVFEGSYEITPFYRADVNALRYFSPRFLLVLVGSTAYVAQVFFMSVKMRIKVFVQNEAGSNRKNYHDEKTLEYKHSRLISEVYPFPYGFIVGTTAADGGNVDCFVITKRPLKTGELLDCEAIALMEQFEDGIEDHNVLARLPDEALEMTAEIQEVLARFVSNVFRHVEGKRMTLGRFLGAQEAAAHVVAGSPPMR